MCPGSSTVAHNGMAGLSVNLVIRFAALHLKFALGHVLILWILDVNNKTFALITDNIDQQLVYSLLIIVYSVKSHIYNKYLTI